MNKYQIIIKNQSGDDSLPDYENATIAKNKAEASKRFWNMLPETYCNETDKIISSKEDWSPEDLKPFIRTVNYHKIVKRNINSDSITKKPIKRQLIAFDKKVEVLKLIINSWDKMTPKEMERKTGVKATTISSLASRLRKRGVTLKRRDKIKKNKWGSENLAFDTAIKQAVKFDAPLTILGTIESREAIESIKEPQSLIGKIIKKLFK